MPYGVHLWRTLLPVKFSVSRNVSDKKRMGVQCDLYNMSRDVRKPDFCICENKDADQLRGNREADQRLCFRYTDSVALPFLKQYSKSLPIFCRCTAQFV